MTALPVVVLHAHRKAVLGDAGIVDQNIERTHRRFGSGNQLLDVRRIGQIAGDDVDALAAERCLQLFEHGGARTRNGDGGARPVQRLGNGSANAARGAGDEGRLARKIEHVAYPCLMSATAAVMSSGVPT